jgi:hypothetical protein
MVTFERYFNRNDFGMLTGSTDVTCLSGKFTEIGSKQVGAKQIIAFGSGEIANGVDSRRNAVIRLDATSGQITAGKVRLLVADANLINNEPVVEDILSNWSSGIALARQNVRAGEDGFLKIQLNPDADTAVDMSDTDIRVDIPVTVQTL